MTRIYAKKTILLLALLLLLAIFFEPVFSAEKRGSGLGDIAFNLSGKDVKGTVYSLDSLRGSFVLVIFWAVDCPVCAVELPRWESFYRKNAGKSFKILSFLINNRLSTEKLKEFIKSRGYTFPVIPLSVEETRKIASDWRMAQTPLAVLINPKGVIVLKDFFGEEGIAWLKTITQKVQNFTPPQIAFKPILAPMGDVVKYQLTFTNVKPNRYNLILGMQVSSVSPSGKLQTSEEFIPITVQILKDEKGKTEIKTTIEKRSLKGEKAKITNEKAVKFLSRQIGNSAYLEVIVPVANREGQVLVIARVYAKELGSYIPLGGGIPSFT